MQDDVAALVEGSEPKRCGHRRVAHDRRRVGDAAARSGIVRSGFAGASTRIRSAWSGSRARLIELHDVKGPRREVVEEHPVAVVRPLGDGDRPAGAEQGEDDRRHRAHPRGVEQRVAAVERAERLLAGDAGRMVGSCVREASRLSVLVRPRRRPVERVAHAPTLSPSVAPEPGSGRRLVEVDLPDGARALIESGRLAHLVTLSRDGSPQVSCVWVGLDGDDIVSAHLSGTQQKIRNVRRDPRVSLSIEGTEIQPPGCSSTSSCTAAPGSRRAALPSSSRSSRTVTWGLP